MTSGTQKVGIIGAGPAGLTAAYELAKRGVSVDVFEGGRSVGGMAGSMPLWGQTVDFGPHRFFSADPRVNAVWHDVMGDDFDVIDRLTRIYYNNTFFDYPLRALNALTGLGFLEAARCLGSYALARVRPRPHESSFENWVINRFGARLFGIFFKSYSEKLWGISCAELDAEFAAQRIKQFSLSEAVKAAVVGVRAGRHKTLLDQFVYPKRGSGDLYRKMADRITVSGGRIHFHAPVRRVGIDTAEQPYVERQSGEIDRFDHVISSMPLTALVAGLDPPAPIAEAAARLRFRNTILAYLEIEGAGYFPDQWIYIHASDLRTGRITNFRNWSPGLEGQSPNTIVCLEYWCNDDDPFWSLDDGQIAALARQEMRQTGLIGSANILGDHIVRVAKSYPIYDHGYRQHLAPVEQFMRGFPRIHPIGRYGAFKYNNQDHSILMGILVAENILGSAAHDLWAINTDSDYQEAATLSEAVTSAASLVAP